MSDARITRRRWLPASALAAAVLAAQEHAHQAALSAQPPSLSVLEAAEAKEIEAIATQSIPADETPGAREAGIIYFIDRALATFDQDKRALYTEGLKALQSKRAALFPDSHSIAALQPARQMRLLRFDAGRREVFQRAKAVVACANGSETPRLLLMSKSSRFPQGLANANGLVGKYLMVDAGFEARGTFEHPLNEFKGVQATRAIHDFYEPDPKRGFYGGGGIDARFDYYPGSFALTGLPPDAPRWGREWKAMVGRDFNRTMTLLAHATCLAREQNSISLDPNVKDAVGLPALRVTFDFHPDDVRNMKFLLDRQLEILQAAGAQRAWPDSSDESLLPHNHLLGTCRMGDDPKTSVVDRYHRTHDVSNLFLVDGSSLVTACCQPTCTIQALAYRAADHIAQQARTAAI